LGTLVIVCLGLIGPFIYSAAHHVRLVHFHFLFHSTDSPPLVGLRDHRGEVLKGCEEIVCQNIVLNIPPGPSR
jgi:hypothetical protein